MIRTSSHCDSGACVGVERRGTNIAVHQVDGGNSTGHVVVASRVWAVFVRAVRDGRW